MVSEQIPDTRYQIPDTRYQIPNTRYQLPDTRYQISDTRFQIPDGVWNVYHGHGRSGLLKGFLKTYQTWTIYGDRHPNIHAERSIP